MRKPRPIQRWGLLWTFRDAVHLDAVLGRVSLFRTREEARSFATHQYGYIRERKDLRSAPHHWQVPRAVRVTVAQAA